MYLIAAYLAVRMRFIWCHILHVMAFDTAVITVKETLLVVMGMPLARKLRTLPT